MSYRHGPYAPVSDERTDADLTVDGELPRALVGTFAQNSPNPVFEPTGPYHWFDGDGMIHAVQLEAGRATYRNRYVQTRKLAADRAAGRARKPGILVDFEPGDPDPDPNTGNTDLVFHHGRLLALWWLGGVPHALTLPELENLGEDAPAGLPRGLAAHPKPDPRTGELVFFDYSLYAEPWLSFGVLAPDGSLAHHAAVELSRPSLQHDIAITERYTILMDLPMTWDARKVAQGKRRVRFDPDQPARFGVVERFGTEVRWFEAEPCYCYHTVNAWEETDDSGQTVIVLIGCRIEDPVPTRPVDADVGVPRLAFLRLEPFLHEWRLELGTGRCTERQLDDIPTEFPKADAGRLGVKTRYAYHPRVAREPTLFFDGFLKYDLAAGTSTMLEYGPGLVGGETWFAPDPDGQAEDDGWVLSMVTDRADDTSALWVVDARDVSAGPVAKVRIPRRVPIGFHATWVA